MQQAVDLGNMEQLHNYAGQLLQQQKNEEAIGVYRKNYEKHPGTFITNIGMARALTVSGANKKALSFAEKALSQAPDDAGKEEAEAIIRELKK